MFANFVEDFTRFEDVELERFVTPNRNLFFNILFLKFLPGFFLGFDAFLIENFSKNSKIGFQYKFLQCFKGFKYIDCISSEISKLFVSL